MALVISSDSQWKLQAQWDVFTWGGVEFRLTCRLLKVLLLEVLCAVEERRKSFETGTGWVQKNKWCVGKKKHSEGPGSSYVEGLLCFFLYSCSPFNTVRNISFAPTLLGRSFSRDVSQPWLTRRWSSLFCAFCQLWHVAWYSPFHLCRSPVLAADMQLPYSNTSQPGT